MFCAAVLLLLLTAVQAQPFKAGKPIPQWKIEEVVKSFSAKNDSTYVINFWATFCKPCIEEIPDFIRLAEKYKSKKVKLLLVSVDLPGYVPARLPDFIKKNKFFTNHVWLNETNADHFCPVIDPKWSGAIPSTLIVNNNTGYRKFAEDQVSATDLEKYLNEAIAGTATRYPMPMNNAELVDTLANNYPFLGESMFYLRFKSNDSAVYAIAGGKVSSIARIEDMKVVIIQDGDGKAFFTYANLGSTKIKTGAIVQPGQLIGFATKDLDADKPTLELYKSDEKGKVVTLTRKNFIARTDKN